jgi:hypothetical protein
MQDLTSIVFLFMHIGLPAKSDNKISEDGQTSYITTIVKKMTILVSGSIYVEYSDIADIISYLISGTGNE